MVFIFNNNEFNSIKNMEGYVMKLKQPEITILWGNDKVKKTYVFENETQKAFFMKGVDEAEGWLSYEVLELYEDVKKEVFNDRL